MGWPSYGSPPPRYDQHTRSLARIYLPRPKKSLRPICMLYRTPEPQVPALASSFFFTFFFIFSFKKKYFLRT